MDQGVETAKDQSETRGVRIIDEAVVEAPHVQTR
jgi:hypothetical protein